MFLVIQKINPMQKPLGRCASMGKSVTEQEITD